MRVSLKTSACAIAVAAVLTGCGLVSGEDEPADDEQQNENVESGSAPDSGESIGEATFPYHGSEGEVTFEINALTERGELLQMDYTVTPGSPDSGAENNPTLRKLFDAGSGENMYLVDTANLRRHTVVADDDNNSLEPDPWDTDLAYDEPHALTAFFASAEDMETVDVYLYGFPPVMDVPVTKAENE